MLRARAGGRAVRGTRHPFSQRLYRLFKGLGLATAFAAVGHSMVICSRQQQAARLSQMSRVGYAGAVLNSEHRFVVVIWALRIDLVAEPTKGQLSGTT